MASEKFPMNKIPVDLRIKIYKLSGSNDMTRTIFTYEQCHHTSWASTIFLAGVFNDTETLALASMKLGKYENETICDFMALTGSVSGLKWARRVKNLTANPSEKRGRPYPFPWGESTFACAARGGNIPVLEWLKKEKCPWNTWACQEAARAGHVEVLKWLQDQQAPFSDDLWMAAACFGQLDVFKWMHDQKFPLNMEDSASAAARCGHVEIVKWFHETQGCPLSKNICDEAAKGGHSNVLNWLNEQKCH